MPVSEGFKKVISAYLQDRAERDELFAVTLQKPAKNIDDCCTYILNQAKKLKQEGFADEEVFGMAVHYYDEDEINVGSPVNGRVVVNHHIDAPPRSVSQPVTQPVKKVEKKPVASNQPSLF